MDRVDAFCDVEAMRDLVMTLWLSWDELLDLNLGVVDVSGSASLSLSLPLQHHLGRHV